MGNYAVSITWPDGFSQVRRALDLMLKMNRKLYDGLSTLVDLLCRVKFLTGSTIIQGQPSTSWQT